jgi:WD40 repeat protein
MWQISHRGVSSSSVKYGLACTDGRLIISGSRDETIRIWDLTSGTLIFSPINAGGYVWAIALSNDGCIAARVEQNVGVWDVKTCCRIASMRGHTSTVYTVTFSPDKLISGSRDDVSGLNQYARSRHGCRNS